MDADVWVSRLAVIFTGMVAVASGIACAILASNQRQIPEVLVVICTASVTNLCNIFATVRKRR